MLVVPRYVKEHNVREKFNDDMLTILTFGTGQNDALAND